MADFPNAITTNGDPTATSTLASVPHAEEHQSHNAEIKATQTKIGTGASTPTAGKVLRGNGTGTSTWAQVVLSTDVAAATSADLRSVLSDETGTGAAVFATSPSITTPQVTTSINDSNGNEVIKTPATGSATNEITVTNAANGNSPTISATGSSDTNVDLTLTPKGTGTIKTSPVNRIDWTALPLGSVVQVATTNFAAVATGTTLIPYDDTIPQITEGDEYMTQVIVPKSATNHLLIEVTAMFSSSAAQDFIYALFQDSTANALAADSQLMLTATGTMSCKLTYDMAAGTTSSTTFRLRAGGRNAGTTTFNGTGVARLYGAISKSNIKITEYKV